jgi:hypothetical protein
MEKITKKQIEQIRKGHHAVLMDCVDFLMDTYNEDKWDLGYHACLADISVHSQRLAECIIQEFNTGGSYLDAPQDNLAEVIENYFKDALKNG